MQSKAYPTKEEMEQMSSIELAFSSVETLLLHQDIMGVSGRSCYRNSYAEFKGNEVVRYNAWKKEYESVLAERNTYR